jgi:hypothetical protein
MAEMLPPACRTGNCDTTHGEDGAVTDVFTRPLLRRDEVRWGSRVPWLAALLATGWALVAGLALASLPGLVVWIGAGAEAPASDPLRIGTAVWLAAHRVGLEVDGAPVQFAPGGLSILIVLLIYRAARWAAHVSGVESAGAAGTVVGSVVAGYAAGAGALAGVSASDQVSADPVQAAVWAAAVSLVAAGFGVVREAGLAHPSARRLPPWQRTAGLAGIVAACALVAVGAVLVAVAAAVHAGRVGALVDTLEPDAPGVVVLAAATAAMVPNLVVWAASFALGPGFAVGAGTAVAPGGVELGLVPALPALGVLPADDLGALGWLVLAGPVAAGCVAGGVIRRRTADSGPWLIVVTVVAAAAVAGLVMALLAWLSGGVAGVDRLAEIGPLPGAVGLAAAGFVAVPALAVALPGRMRGRRS